MPVPLPPGPVPGTLAALAGSGESTSAAIVREGRVHFRREPGVARHSLHLVPLLEALLAEAGLPKSALDAVAFARGPGPFTGGRIVVATAQGLGLGLDRPLIPISSLAAAAWTGGGERSAVALDAGQGEVYWGLFRREEAEMALIGEEEVAPPETVTAAPGEGPWTGVGGGWGPYGEALQERLPGPPAAIRADIDVSADAVAALGVAPWRRGAVIGPAEAVPTYLRGSYAERS